MATRARKSSRKKGAAKRGAARKAGARKGGARKRGGMKRGGAKRGGAKRRGAKRSGAKRAGAKRASRGGGRRQSPVARVKRVTREVVQQASDAVSSGVETLKDLSGNLVERVRSGV